MPIEIYKRKKGYKRPPFTKKWCENISNGRKGQPAWNKGKKTGKSSMTKEEQKIKGKKISKAKKGIPHFHQRGEKSGQWKGGITSLHRYIRTCFEYRQWRSDVFTRDNYTCIWCGVRSGNGKTIILNVDHIKPYSLIIEENNIKSYEEAVICEELWNINNGRTLCIDCHKTTETFAGKTRRQDIEYIKVKVK